MDTSERLLETSERENFGAASSSWVAPGIPGQGDGLGSRAVLEGMRKPGCLCSILVCIPSLPSHFPDSGQKHGDSRVVSQVLRVKKAQLTVTEMPGCGAAHRGQGQGSAEQLRGGGAGDAQGWITNLCTGPWPFSAS